MAEPFFWGAGGSKVSSPESAARQRAIAEALIGRSSTPAQNWAQGLADVAAAWSGTQLRNQADEAEQEGQRAVAELLAGLTPESGFSDISAVMANPWATASQSAVAQALMGNQFNRANIADERAYQAGLLADQRAYDQPVRDLELEGARLANAAAQAQLDALLSPPPAEPIKVGDVLLDPVTFEPLFDARGEAGFTLSPGQQRFDASGNPIAGVEEPPKPGGEMFDVEGKLRTEYQGQQGYKDFVQQEQAYQRVLDSAKEASPAGDLALIFNYMKVLDPGSVVRESEFATAAASGSFGDRIQAATEQVLSGKRLSPEQRRDFVQRAGDLFAGASGLYGGMNERYSTLAGEYGIDPTRIIRPGAQIGVMSPEFSIDEYLGISPTSPLSQDNPAIFGNTADDPLGLR